VDITTVHFRAPKSASSKEAVRLVGTLYRSSRPFLPGTSGHSSSAETAAARPGLVVGHGAGSHRGRHDRFCRTACDAGFVVLALDFRGHGESEGVADGPLELDLLSAARFLRETEGVDAASIAYRGSSMGGFYGLQAAPAAGFSALALVCPASRAVLLEAVKRAEQATEEDDGAAPAPPRRAQDSDQTPPARWDLPAMRRYLERVRERTAAGKVTCPVLILHARGDDVVPLEHSLVLARHLPGEVTIDILPGGSHTSAQHDSELHRFTAHWLSDRVTSCG
jgi:pimeloyl-ACP methyl ester carboxylesterase